MTRPQTQMTEDDATDGSTDRRTYLKFTSVMAGWGLLSSLFPGHAAAEPHTDTNSPHQLPGRIQAEDFDNSGEGNAYHDTDSTNEGSAYRPSEGVDIQPTHDESGNYNIGWTRDGEWLTYTVAIPAGLYDIDLRVAAPSNSDGDICVLLDGMELGIATVASTGGWQSWETITIPGVAVPDTEAGRLRIEFTTSNQHIANFNWIEFVETDMDPDSDSNAATIPETITPKNINNELYASAFDDRDLSENVRAALDALPGGQGRIRITPRDDGQPWQWEQDLTIDISQYNGLELDIDRTVGIEYSGSGWPLTLVGNSSTSDQARITGGRWTATGDPAGWLRIKDCFGTEIYPTRVAFRNSSGNAVGVSLENHDGWTESSKIGGSYTADIGIDSKPAGLTGGTGTESFHDTVLDNPKINAYNIGIRFRGWWQYCHIEKPVVWTKTDGVSCYVLGAERMDGTNILSMKAETAAGQESIGIETAGDFEGFWYGPTIIGGLIDVNGTDVVQNGAATGPAIQIHTRKKAFQINDLASGDSTSIDPRE